MGKVQVDRRGLDAIRDKRKQMMRRRVHADAMHQGAMSLRKVVQLWVWAVGNSRLPFRLRNKAAENLAERFGMPRVAANLNLTPQAVPPKTIVIDHFEAPGTYSDEPPPEVKEALEKFNAEHNGGSGNGAADGANGAGG